MKRAVFVLICLLLPALCSAEAIRVQAGRSVRIAVPGATAAFSLNSLFAEAVAEEGVVVISGKQPGSTNIVVVTVVGTQTLQVVVVEPPPVYPPGFFGSAPAASESETTSYEFRYSSIPSQQQNVIDATERTGGRSFRFHLANANLFDNAQDSGYSAVRFPSVFYEVKMPEREITFLDQYVITSPLTVDNALVRGVHVRDGSWTVHAGYSSLSAFQNLFLPSDREVVLGASYERRLTGQSRVAGNLYGYPARHDRLSGIPGGVAGSMLYEYKRPNELMVLAEVGVSDGAGFAFRAEKTKGKSQYRHNIRYKPSGFAGLSTDGNRGFLADGTWNRPLSERVDLRAMYFANRYSLPQFRQTNVGGNVTLRYDATKHWAFTGGATYGRLKPDMPPGPGIESKSLPLGVDFKSKVLSAGYQHVFTRNGGGRDLGGREDRVNVGTGWGSWRVNAFWDQQTQAPSADFIVDETPGLRDLMDRLGLTATSTEQIAQLMQQDVVLLQLGYLRSIQLNLSPRRTQAGANLIWAGQGRLAPQVTASYLDSRDDLLLGSSRSRVAALSLMCHLPARMDLFASWSLYSSTAPGMSINRRSQLDFSVRRRFSGAPDWLFPSRGAIDGRVFEDDRQQGEWQQGARGMPNVVVVLDGTRETRTGPEGRFRFTGVSSGRHEVEVLFESDLPFYFTTPSRRQVTAGSRADFGVAFATSMLIGYVFNDAHAGLSGVQITVSGVGGKRDTATDSDGRFSLQGLAPGEYEVTPAVDSFAPGYILADVTAQRVQVGLDTPGRAEFTVRAARALAGIVTIYDAAQSRQVPVEGVAVRLRELGLETTTGKDGAYIFRDLPAGQFTVVISYEGKEFVRSERLTPEPIFIRNADINLGAK